VEILSPGRAWLVMAALAAGSGSLFAQSRPAAAPASAAGVGAAPQSRAPRATPTATEATQAAPDSLDDVPVSLERIREALERAPTPVIKLPERPTFSVRVDGKLPAFEDFVAPGELRTYAMPAAMSHHEFLDMVTPPEYRAYASSVNGELVQLIATSVAAKLAMSSVTNAIKQGWHDRKERQARDEVDAVLEALRARDEAAAASDTDQRPADPPPR
jgi:hypothetical protein